MSVPVQSRRFLPQPVETTTKSKRQHIPESEEEISKNDREPRAYRDLKDTSDPVRKRFSPLPVETTVKSNRKAAVPERIRPPDAPRIRPVPPPVETTTTRSRRIFSPQLIETTKRSRKTGDVGPALLPADKTEILHGNNVPDIRPLRLPRPSALPLPPLNTPISSTGKVPQLPESRYASSNLSRNAPRRRSFRIPDLAPIQSRPDSEESEESNCPSLSTSPSTSSQDTALHKHGGRLRESCDDRFSGYLLALAARAAEKQLRDQAMAAYPNEAQHEPVDHFAIDKESDTSDEEANVGLLPHERGDIDMLRRKSTVDAGWEIEDLGIHQGVPELQVEKLKQTGQTHFSGRTPALGPSQKGPQAIKQDAHAPDASSPFNNAGGAQKGAGLDRMRNAANPPMLGTDIEFPLCESPRRTQFKVDQHPFPQQGSGANTPRDESGLWTPGAANSRNGSGKGLWMGVCAVSDNTGLAPPNPARTGLITPGERADQFLEITVIGSTLEVPASSSGFHSKPNLACVDDLLLAEQQIQHECNDAFVTQVYNYLSLGYPSLARKFDVELCKITRVPIEELRRDDKLTNSKGYVGTPEGNGITQDGVSDGQCSRWRALKLYVREWARQKPRMAATPDLDAWGDRARRGSWAI